MKFKRDALLGATQRALDEHRAAFDAEEAKRASEGATRLAEWLNVHGAKWAEFAEHVAYLIAHGYPVTENDIPRVRGKYGYGNFAVGHESWLTPPDAREYQPPSELVNLRNVLRYTEDELVTTAGLKGLGVEPMRTVLRYL